MVKISVIMPVYNSEQYLRETVNSILNQDMDDFELILVDDGSTDSSGLICDEYRKKDSRVVVAHKKNGGICSARNHGLQLARGEYIAFSDDDDEYLPGLLRDNYRLAVEHQADVVRYSRKRVTSKYDKILYENTTDDYPFQIIESEEFSKYFEIIGKTGYGIWTGLYRRAFLQKNNIRFDESIRYGFEDCLFILQCYSRCKTIVLNPKVYYLWKQRVEHSTSVRFEPNVIMALKKCILFEQKLVRHKNVQEVSPGVWQQLLTSFYLFFAYNRIGPNVNNISNREKRTILRNLRHDKRIDFHLTQEDRRYMMHQSIPIYLFRVMFDIGFVWCAYYYYHFGQKAVNFFTQLKKKRNHGKQSF